MTVHLIPVNIPGMSSICVIAYHLKKASLHDFQKGVSASAESWMLAEGWVEGWFISRKGWICKISPNMQMHCVLSNINAFCYSYWNWTSESEDFDSKFTRLGLYLTKLGLLSPKRGFDQTPWKLYSPKVVFESTLHIYYIISLYIILYLGASPPTVF